MCFRAGDHVTICEGGGVVWYLVFVWELVLTLMLELDGWEVAVAAAMVVVLRTGLQRQRVSSGPRTDLDSLTYLLYYKKIVNIVKGKVG